MAAAATEHTPGWLVLGVVLGGWLVLAAIAVWPTGVSIAETDRDVDHGDLDR